MLTDNHQRIINYVRLAVTDRCNLRCTYCMPEHMQFRERAELLSYEEIVRLMNVLASNGVNKVRITGGEPFLRKDLMRLLEQLTPIASVSITTNGVLTEPFIPQLKALGIEQVNLSLIHCRHQNSIALPVETSFMRHALNSLIAQEMPVKVNMVVMDGINTDELSDLYNSPAITRSL